MEPIERGEDGDRERERERERESKQIIVAAKKKGINKHKKQTETQ